MDAAPPAGVTADADRRLSELRTAARRAVADAGALRVDPVERARRARDYRTWALMRDCPQRVRDLATRLLGPDAADTARFDEACIALTALLAELYEGEAPPATDQEGQ